MTVDRGPLLVEELTKNQRWVLDALRRHGSCRTAYELLDELRGRGMTAATSVYRALDTLTAEGLVHRVESRNAFVACQYAKHVTVPALTICRSCDQIEEIEPGDLKRVVGRWCRKSSFLPEVVTLEISGLCGRCRDGTAPHATVA